MQNKTDMYETVLNMFYNNNLMVNYNGIDRNKFYVNEKYSKYYSDLYYDGCSGWVG